MTGRNGRSAPHRPIALAGGGTGGHLFPGLALRDEIRSLGAEVIGLGPGRAIEQDVAPDWIPVPSPRRPSSAGQILSFPARSLFAFLRCREVLRDRGVRAVVGLGGYGSLFPGLAAIAGGIPLFLLEQNAVPGRVTRLLAHRARTVYSPWEVDEITPVPRAEVRPYGNPIRPEVLRHDRGEALRRWGFRADRRTLLIMGGSQGALGLNRRILRCLRSGPRPGPFQVIHLTGTSLRMELGLAYEAAGIRARTIPFLEAIGAAYAAADLVIARAGGTTIAEICAWGLPSVLVPFPHAADGHQDANAARLECAGAAWRVPEEEFDSRTWGRITRMLLGDRERDDLGRGAARRGRPEAGRRIAEEILEAVGGIHASRGSRARAMRGGSATCRPDFARAAGGGETFL